MKSEHYEELCRRFVANVTGLPIEEVLSGDLPSPHRPDVPRYRHQIDLHWETGDEFARYFNIANAKWRSSGKVEQGDVLLLQQVRVKVSAHKAFMITNVGFTAGARAAAMDDGMGLHIVDPAFEDSALPAGDRSVVQAAIAALCEGGFESTYSHRVEHRGFDFQDMEPPPHPGTVPPVAAPERVETRDVPATRPRTSGFENRGGGSGPGVGGSSRGGGFEKR